MCGPSWGVKGEGNGWSTHRRGGMGGGIARRKSSRGKDWVVQSPDGVKERRDGVLRGIV